MMSESASHRAEDLIDRAWEARTEKTRVKLARQAIEIDPDAIDGYVILGMAAATSIEAIAILREGMKRGSGVWAAEMKRPSEHPFWLDVDTRPFMRVVHNLALALWNNGDRAGAIEQAKLLLRLNPNDNQGIRALLWSWYPAVGDWSAAEKVLKRYPDDGMIERSYAALLLALHRGEPIDELVKDAIEANPYVPLFLADPEAVVEDDDDIGLVGYVARGSPAEAAGYAAFSREGWRGVPSAIERLLEDSSRLEASD